MSDSKISSNATPFWKNGHYYSMSEEKKDWYAARSAAQNANFNGLYGYLATITDSEENTF